VSDKLLAEERKKEKRRIIIRNGASLGDILRLLRFLLLFFFFLSFSLPPKVYLTHFSPTTERKSMKFHRNVKHYE
jgi:hypothetical protein